MSNGGEKNLPTERLFPTTDTLPPITDRLISPETNPFQQLRESHPGIEYLHSIDLGTCTEYFLGVCIQQIADLKNGKITIDQIKQPVFINHGKPDVGKSYAAKQVIAAINNSTNSFFEIKTIVWDEVEDQLRKEGIITTPPGEPLTDAELRATARRLEQEVAKEIVHPDPHKIVIVDKPGATAFKQKNGMWMITREYGCDFIDKLSSGRLIWEEKKEDATIVTHKIPGSSLFIATAGYTAGPNMEVLLYYRSLIKHAQDIDEANYYANVFGFPPYKTQEEFQKAQHGGTISQVRKARARTWSLFGYTRSQIKEACKDFPDYIFPLLKYPNPRETFRLESSKYNEMLTRLESTPSGKQFTLEVKFAINLLNENPVMHLVHAALNKAEGYILANNCNNYV
ncbi:MAG TPA: hypothetical protein VLF89_04890, partial [Candidatus Saccharimonadales bacterium]|nr:hypothetical protein [Candidatus Saccharimonadales bacterium]